MATKKTSKKPAPKTYATLRAIRQAVARRQVRGIKVSINMNSNSVEFKARGVLLYQTDLLSIAESGIEALGFKLA